MENALDSRARQAFVWFGFALFVVTYSGGPFIVTYGPVEYALSWSHGLFGQVLFMVGIASGCLMARVFVHKEFLKTWYVIGMVGYATVTVLGLVIQTALSSATSLGIEAQAAMSLLVGAVYAQPLLFWLDMLTEVSGRWRRSSFLTALAASYLFLNLFIVISPLLGGVEIVPPLIQMACSLLVVLIGVGLLRKIDPPVEMAERVPESYCLTRYSAVVIGCLGFSWGIAEGWNALLLGVGWLTKGAFDMLMGVVGTFIVIGLIWVFTVKNGIRFGSFVRLSVVVCGASLAAVPLVLESAPASFFPLCEMPMVFAEISVIVFTIEICQEKGMHPIRVYAANFTLFAAAVCIAAAFFWLVQTSTDELNARLLTTLVAVWAVLVVIPFLPSRTSDAVAFTLEKLPEEEGYEVSVALLRERLAQKYGLTDSEAEVLKLLLQGLNREQIAAQVYLSPWTVKARIGSIYRKCGIHSYKELVKLVSSEDF